MLRLADEGDKGIFGPTIQGEVSSPFGNLTWFIRLHGCGLKCDWCDTKHANENKFFEKQADEIIAQLNQNKTKIVTISGGEPLEQDITSLVFGLKNAGYIVCLETAGYKFAELPFDWVVISPKLRSSSDNAHHQIKRYNMGSFINWMQYYKERSKWKFVVNRYGDVEEIIEYFVDPLEIPRSDIYLMPKAGNLIELEQNQLTVAEMAIRCGFNYSSRLQVSLWGTERGR